MPGASWFLTAAVKCNFFLKDASLLIIIDDENKMCTSSKGVRTSRCV